jgi:hypothetical protein
VQSEEDGEKKNDKQDRQTGQERVGEKGGKQIKIQTN